MVFYFFVSILISVVFLAINLALLPFAYLKTIWHKITLKKAKIIDMTDLLSYILFGLITGLIVQVPDLWAFLKTSWRFDMPKRNDTTFVIDRETFELFYKTIVDFERKGDPILAFELIDHIRKLLELENQILTAIYGVNLKAMKMK